ncbi:hypothetical protein BSL78_06608 [Apostichopus japonicus]|uniref:Uncharacterized protein n=1 Tax=Stichopus japonicus TaxID=307972 RepID=A0A2G8L8A2_STIJA|nr:hypothetical protein BSL78_06608 [Apostichopus japonicus]
MAKAIVRDFKQLDNEDRDGYVLEFMAKTAKARAADIRDNKQKKFSDILKEYPRLIDTDGMVEQDFKILFPEACDALFMKWPSLEEKVLAYANKQVDWKDILHFHGNLSTNEKRSNIAIQVLPLLFPPGMSRTVGKKGPNKHATIPEALCRFIQFEEALFPLKNDTLSLESNFLPC